MIAKILSSANVGYSGQPIYIECGSTNGLPALVIVGLGNKAIDEAKERIRSAVRSSGHTFPRKRVVVNLAPADLPKDGSSYDVPMALAILANAQHIVLPPVHSHMFVGELALNGDIRPVRGIIGHVQTAKQAGAAHIIVPAGNVDQASLVDGIAVYGAANLGQIIAHLQGKKLLMQVAQRKITSVELPTYSALDDIVGHDAAKRALLIAAAGQHNIRFIGPPGSGKTLLARALCDVLPAPSAQEILSITKLHSLGNASSHIVTQRPLRSPHHTTSQTALIGGGHKSLPGEISLAHQACCF